MRRAHVLMKAKAYLIASLISSDTTVVSAKGSGLSRLSSVKPSFSMSSVQTPAHVLPHNGQGLAQPTFILLLLRHAKESSMTTTAAAAWLSKAKAKRKTLVKSRAPTEPTKSEPLSDARTRAQMGHATVDNCLAKLVHGRHREWQHADCHYMQAYATIRISAPPLGAIWGPGWPQSGLGTWRLPSS